MERAIQRSEEEQPRGYTFNLDALTDDQITILNQTLFDASTARGVGSEVDTLQELLADEVRIHAGTNPDRVRELVKRLARSRHEGDRFLAVLTVPALLDHDYAFTRDVLVFLCVDEDAARPPSDGLYSEQAWHAIARLVRDSLTAAQIDDFRARLAFFNHDLPA